METALCLASLMLAIVALGRAKQLRDRLDLVERAVRDIPTAIHETDEDLAREVRRGDELARLLQLHRDELLHLATEARRLDDHLADHRKFARREDQTQRHLDAEADRARARRLNGSH